MLVALIGIVLFINLVLFIVIITLSIYIKRNNKKIHTNKLEHRKLPKRPDDSLYDFIDETVIQNKLKNPSDALPISKQPKLSSNQSEHGYLNYPGKVSENNFKYVNMN